MDIQASLGVSGRLAPSSSPGWGWGREASSGLMGMLFLAQWWLAWWQLWHREALIVTVSGELVVGRKPEWVKSRVTVCC